MADVLSILTTPVFDLIDLALDSPLAAVVAVVVLGLVVLAVIV